MVMVADDLFICCHELLLANLTDPLNLQRIAIVDLLDLLLALLLSSRADHKLDLLFLLRLLTFATTDRQQLLQVGLRRLGQLSLR